MKHINWNEVEAAKPGEFNKLPAGGYICQITAAEDEPKKEYLRFEFDIADGEYKGYYRDLYDNKKFWAASFIKSYKTKAQGFFKLMLDCFEKSNRNFSFHDDERELRGKYIGLVLGYEEYVGNDNKVKQRIIVTDFKTVKEIQNGEFDIPELKKLSDDNFDRVQDASSAVANDDDDDVPF